jgi:hypothetical protein
MMGALSVDAEPRSFMIAGSAAVANARLHNSDVAADVALSRCAPSGPRS